MSLQSTGYLINETESGSWLDGFWGWAGDTATKVGDAYVDRWLSEQFPETVEPWNPDEPFDNVSAEAGSVQQGFLDNPDNQTLLLVAVVGALALFMMD
ncbi:MAG: hypothetical protein AB2758_20695 [Candidatus Thiodiazotropha endolucinida]